MNTGLPSIYVLFLLTMLLIVCSKDINKHVDPYQVEILGSNYEWIITYPGEDGELYTDDDVKAKKNLVLPYQRQIELVIKSEDYLYFFELADFNQMGMAVTDKTNYLHFLTTKTGTFELKGSQMCAYTHDNLLGKVSVYRPFLHDYIQKRI